jgi:hypothetical protein
MEIVLPFPQDRSSISLNDLLNHDFGREHMDNRVCKNVNISNTSEVTTSSIHTHLDVLIIMLQCNCWNNNSERINTRVNFSVSELSQIKALIMMKCLQNTTSLLPYAIKNQEIKLQDTSQHNARSRIVMVIGLNTRTQVLS